MIPASLINPKSLENLVQYLSTQVWRAQGERLPLEQRWMKYDKAYRALPETDIKRFPFEGAANLTIPVIATDIDTIFSRIMGILFAPENLWSCRPLNDQWADYAPKLEEFLEYAQKHEIGAYDSVADFTMELCKLGTGILKTRYRREVKQVYQFRESDQGTLEQILQVMMKDSPSLDHVSLYDFYVPATAKNIQEAPWAAERVRLSRTQLENRVRSGLYVIPPGGFTSWYHANNTTMENQRQQQDAFVAGMPEECELFECWLDWDLRIDTSDPEENLYATLPQAIVATIHPESRTLVRVDFNPYFNQEKPYDFARYLRQDKRFYGIGLCEMLFMFQEEVTAMHNQRLDNATLANTTMLKGKKGIGLREDEPFIPGRIWLLDNPATDLVPMAVGQKYDSTVPYEELTMTYARRRSGVNDYVEGNSTPAVGYGAAATTMTMLKEAAKRFDQVMREVRICLGASGQRIVELYQQFNQHGKEYLVMGQKEGEMVHQILQFPLELIRKGIVVDVTATSASANKDVEIRTNTIIMQMMMQYYTQLMQAMSYVVNPQVPEPLRILALSMAQSGSILVKKILDGYGMQDADKVIPQLEDILNGGQQTLASIRGAFTGGAPGDQGFVPSPSMGALPAVPVGAPAAIGYAAPTGYAGGGGLPASGGNQYGR